MHSQNTSTEMHYPSMDPIKQDVFPSTSTTHIFQNKPGEVNSNFDVFTFPEHVKVNFNEIFKEPEEIRLFEAFHRISNPTFTYVTKVLYNILGVVIGVPLGVLWGIIFALTNFCIVWMVQPFIKSIFICLRVSAMIPRAMIRLCCDPLFESIAIIYSRCRGNFNIHLSQDPEKIPVTLNL